MDEVGAGEAGLLPVPRGGRQEMIKAILWDLGGVITTSPFEAFRRYEMENDLPEDFIRSVNSRNRDANAWARFERSEISLEEFDRAFERETQTAGHAVRGIAVLELLSGDIRPEMVEALRRCGERYLTCCLTNNVNMAGPDAQEQPSERARALRLVMDLFDVVIESSKVGLRKPDPLIYRMACDRLGVRPGEAVFLDDLGINLKPAREMGMHTIKVTDPFQALRELEAILGITLLP